MTNDFSTLTQSLECRLAQVTTEELMEEKTVASIVREDIGDEDRRIFCYDVWVNGTVLKTFGNEEHAISWALQQGFIVE